MTKINNFLDKPLNKFILWFLTGLLITIIGIFPVKADSLFNNNTIHFYNNNGGSYNDVGTSFIDQTGESWSTLTTVADSYGGLVAIQLSSPLIQGHIYTLFLNVGAESNGGQTRLSAKNCLGIGGSYDASNTSYLNCEIVPRFSDYSLSTSDKSRGVYYTFIANKNGIILSVPYTSQYTCNGCRNYSYGYTIQDNGDSSVLTQAQINTIINNQSNNINSSIQSSTNNIQSSINQTEQNIIDNQNENQDKTNDLLGNCKKNLINLNDVNTSDSLSGYRYRVSLTAGKTYTIRSYDNLFNFKIGSSRYSYTDNEGSNSSISYTFTYTPNSNNTEHYLMVYYPDAPGANLSTHQLVLVEGNYSGPFINYNEQVCSSKLDDTNQAINDVNDTLNNDDVDSSKATETLTDLSNSTASNSVISDLLLLPVRLFQNIVNSINGSCSPFNLGTLYNTNLTLPCIDISSLIGSTLWSVIDILFCGSFILVIRKKFVDIFENLSELKNGGNEVE